MTEDTIILILFYKWYRSYVSYTLRAIFVDYPGLYSVRVFLLTSLVSILVLSSPCWMKLVVYLCRYWDYLEDQGCFSSKAKACLQVSVWIFQRRIPCCCCCSSRSRCCCSCLQVLTKTGNACPRARYIGLESQMQIPGSEGLYGGA